MLHVWIMKRPENYQWSTDSIFEEEKKVSWFNDPKVIKIIETVDKNEVKILEPYNPSNPRYSNYVIVSPVFGYITPDQLSTGCKTLILSIMCTKYVYSTLRMGENVAKLMGELSLEMDITICVETSVSFDVPVHILNDDSYTHNSQEYFSRYIRISDNILEEELGCIEEEDEVFGGPS